MGPSQRPDACALTCTAWTITSSLLVVVPSTLMVAAPLVTIECTTHCAVTDDPKMVKTLFAPKGNGNERNLVVGEAVVVGSSLCWLVLRMFQLTLGVAVAQSETRSPPSAARSSPPSPSQRPDACALTCTAWTITSSLIVVVPSTLMVAAPLVTIECTTHRCGTSAMQRSSFF